MTPKSLDKPPILKFLILFIGLLVAALGLAALSPAAQLPSASEPASTGVEAATTAPAPHSSH
jgi:hypothetical protein